MGQVPSAWNALPPLLHLANSYSSFKTRLEQHLLQESYPDFPGCPSLLPLCSHVLCFPFCLRASMLSMVVTLSLSPPADCELLEGRAGCPVPVLSVCGECW